MKILGYLLVLALFGGNNKYNNFSIEVQKVRQLVKDIFKHDETKNEPHFTVDDLRRGNLINKGTVAKYYSKAIRDYIIYHNVSSEEEGFVLTFNNFNLSPSAHADNKAADNKVNTPTVIFVPKEGVDVNDVSNKDLRTAIADYIDTVQEKINSHEIGVAPAKSDLLELDVENNHLTVTPTLQNGTKVPKELSKSRVYKPNKLHEDETKISNDLRVENNTKVSKDQNKTNVPDDHISKVPREKLGNVSLDKNGTSKNKEIKKSDLNKFLYERKIQINPDVADNPDEIGLKVIEDKFINKITTTPQNNGIPDLLCKHDSLVYKQKAKEHLSKTIKNIANHSFNALEDKQKIHKKPQAIEKSHIDLKPLDINNMRNGSISTETINDNENKPENNTILEAKSGNGFESHSKGEEHQTKYPTIGESELTVPKEFHVNDFENKTTTGDKKQIVLEEVNTIKSNDSDLLKSYEKVSVSPVHKLTKLDKPEEHREQEFQVNELIKKDRNKDGIDNKINSKLETNNENVGEFKHNESIAERPSFNTDKEETSKSGNKRKCESENNQNVRNETNNDEMKRNEKDSKDLKDLVKPIETETVDSQEPSEANSKWNNGENLNGEENNNSEEETEREPFLEVLNLDEIERAQEQGFAIELPNNEETVTSSSSEEEDWDENDDYDEY